MATIFHILKDRQFHISQKKIMPKRTSAKNLKDGNRVNVGNTNTISMIFQTQ